MKISKIKIPIEITKATNLKEINLTKKNLGSTIALVGKNGAGKSRILKFVETYIQNIPIEQFLGGYFQNIPTLITDIKSLDRSKKMINPLINGYLNDQQISSMTKNSMVGFHPFFQRFRQLGKAYIKVVDNDDLKIIKSNINDKQTLTFDQILTNKHFDDLMANPHLALQQDKHPKILLNEFAAFNNQSTIQYFEELANKIALEKCSLLINDQKPTEIINDEIKKNKSFQLFSKFQEYVKKFLGNDFSYKTNTQGNVVKSILHYNNVPFDLNLLSPGQKTLFAYAILFFYLDTNSKANIKESIIIIDEPEKHLHPEAQITLINAIKSIISESGQLWLATHSIHILSHLQYDEIMMVKDDGIISPSRTTPGKSFNELMGLDDHIIELTTFINSISEWAYGNFMMQCFKEPEVVFGNNPNDSQFKLFKEFLSAKTNINLLDYGAGKGRIGYTLNEDKEVSQKLKYSAFELNKKHDRSLNAIPNIEKTYSQTSDIPADFFDCVLLCNVLHEINPMDWENTLNAIKKILKKDGYLLIIEDKYLPKGETAHEFGYLILGSDETKILLNSNKVLELKLKETEIKDRIIFNSYKKEQIKPNHESVIEAIKALEKNSFNNLKKMRKLKKTQEDVSHGRQYANETQLHINSKLALDSI